MPDFHYTDLFSTYSIVARDAETGQMGVAVQTHQMSVGRVVPWVAPGYGVMATQSLTNISFGPMALEMLQQKMSAPQIIASLVAGDPMENRRQMAVVDAKGNAAAHTGDGCIAHAGHYVGEGYSVQANMMTNTTVIDAMKETYESTTGDLAQRMIATLEAAQAEDGDIRGMQSAAIRIVSGDVHDFSWNTLYDLRVDEHEIPVTELARLVRLRRAQHMDQDAQRFIIQGEREQGLALWEEARRLAPELEELGYWQAVTLLDRKPYDDAVELAAQIFHESFTDDERREHWIDLTRRLEDCGLIERIGAVDEFFDALKAMTD